jgi:hypothetical protein
LLDDIINGYNEQIHPEQSQSQAPQTGQQQQQPSTSQLQPGQQSGRYIDSTGCPYIYEEDENGHRFGTYDYERAPDNFKFTHRCLDTIQVPEEEPNDDCSCSGSIQPTSYGTSEDNHYKFVSSAISGSVTQYVTFSEQCKKALDFIKEIINKMKDCPPVTCYDSQKRRNSILEDYRNHYLQNGYSSDQALALAEEATAVTFKEAHNLYGKL